MASLICDHRPAAGELEEEYRLLCAAGESVALHWPRARPAPPFAAPGSSAELDAAFEDGRLVCFGEAALPGWLTLDDFDRILLISEAPEIDVQAEDLFRRGAAEIEGLRPESVRELRQSWHSGRRTGGVVLRR